MSNLKDLIDEGTELVRARSPLQEEAKGDALAKEILDKGLDYEAFGGIYGRWVQLGKQIRNAADRLEAGEDEPSSLVRSGPMRALDDLIKTAQSVKKRIDSRLG